MMMAMGLSTAFVYKLCHIQIPFEQCTHHSNVHIQHAQHPNLNNMVYHRERTPKSLDGTQCLLSTLMLGMCIDNQIPMARIFLSVKYLTQCCVNMPHIFSMTCLCALWRKKNVSLVSFNLLVVVNWKHAYTV